MTSKEEYGMTFCSQCNGTTFDIDPLTGTKFCKTCGLVKDDEKDCVCLGSPRDISSKGIATLLNIGDYRLKSTYTINSSERSFQTVIELMAQWSFALSLSTDVRERGAYLYSELLKKKKTQGRKIEELAVACLYLAAKEINPRPILAFEKTTLVKRKAFMRQVRVIEHELDFKAKTVTPESLVPFLCGRLELTFEVEKQSQLILKKSGDVITNPRTKAAAAVYLGAMMMGTPVSLSQCSLLTYTSEGTLAKNVETLKKYL